MFPVPLLHEKAKELGLEYLLIGGHAVNAYCEPRTTLDVDFLVRKDEEARWCNLLKSEGFQLDYTGPTFARFTPPYGIAWRLDLMLVSAETFRKMWQAARIVDVLGISARLPIPEHLIALKLHAMKHGPAERLGKDFIDVVSLTRNAGLDPKSDAYRRLFEQFGTMELYERILEQFS